MSDLNNLSDEALKRQRDRKNDMKRDAGSICRLMDRIARNRRYLDPEEKHYQSRRPVEEIQEQLRSDLETFERMSSDLAHHVSWFFEDN